MPETLAYSVVGAVNALWLAARCRGVGWVSILDPARIKTALDVPDAWSLVAYLCLGYPVEEHVDPELERHGWQDRLEMTDLVFQRRARTHRPPTTTSASPAAPKPATPSPQSGCSESWSTPTATCAIRYST